MSWSEYLREIAQRFEEAAEELTSVFELPPDLLNDITEEDGESIPRTSSFLSEREQLVEEDEEDERILRGVDLNNQDSVRKKIQEIQSQNEFDEKRKASVMQKLLMSGYVKYRKDKKKLTVTDESGLNFKDLEPSFHDKEHDIYGCKHYMRNCKKQCADCKQWFPCRHCHNEVSDHTLNRNATENMLCMFCLNTQPAAEKCKFCRKSMARYYCKKCKLWDDDPSKTSYHCDDCGICRIGRGVGDDYYHCKICGICLPIAVYDTHRCIERSTDCNCPICGEYMFNSTERVAFLPCSHPLHQRCYGDYIKTNYRCPTCSKTIINVNSMFRILDMEVERQPMPYPYNTWISTIHCNDCSSRSDTNYHFLGHKCKSCHSYNTCISSIYKPLDHPQVSIPRLATAEDAGMRRLMGHSWDSNDDEFGMFRF
ncbi:ubiquitin-protein ligase E3, implicated in DNA repair [Schizosaccharomyces osmophilus]|uniref:Ubiquitin-protein ligase E3, implicated in DNA repair n=1 Tax=Schizosaccharomyces osmophilus TaxID=2545709 RepID=A0AAF0AYJ1_9SCHI|nr:ubiquitin-protein ligase E3, implicated in DNA repair [Schizosaccharomyces osmophilus]WBW75080.1 ubiquitin-protein ligase E3, implicated in DNA repair [Schizosaccharomyces osmophilus]